MEEQMTSRFAAIVAKLPGEEVFVREVVLPMEDLNGVAVELVAANCRCELVSLGEKVLDQLLATPMVEIVLSAKNMRETSRLMERLLDYLLARDSTLGEKLIKHSNETVWFKFPTSESDIRKIHFMPRTSARHYRGMSPDTLYIVKNERAASATPEVPVYG